MIHPVGGIVRMLVGQQFPLATKTPDNWAFCHCAFVMFFSYSTRYSLACIPYYEEFRNDLHSYFFFPVKPCNSSSIFSRYKYSIKYAHNLDFFFDCVNTFFICDFLIFLLHCLIALLCYQIMSTKTLQRSIARIKQEIIELGPLRPGTLYSRYSVCGKPGCRCARKRKPLKHGPYHYLSYTFAGKSHTEFVPAEQLKKVQKEVSNYNRLRKLVRQLVINSMKLARQPKS